MMDRFRRIFQRHPNEEIPLIPKEKKKSIGQRLTSAVRKRVHKGYTKIPTIRGEGRRRRKRASAVKAMSTIRRTIRRRKTRKPRRARKMYK